MSDYLLGNIAKQNFSIQPDTQISKQHGAKATNLSTEKLGRAKLSLDSTDSLGSGDGLSEKISAVLNSLESLNSSGFKSADINLDSNVKEKFISKVNDLMDNLNAVSSSPEFSEVKEQLDKLNLKLNIESPEEQEFIKHFTDNLVSETKPDLVGIFDQINNLNDLVMKNFKSTKNQLVALKKSSKEEEESIALLNKETAQLNKEINLSSLQDQFLEFESKTFQVDDKNILVGINGLRTSEEMPKKFNAAYLYKADSGEIAASFSHPDFKDNLTFKGAKLSDNNVSINSNGSEYIFSREGEFQTKISAPGGNNRITESVMLDDKLYAIAAASEKNDGQIVGALYKFDLKTGELFGEFKSPSETNGTFGSNITQGSHGRLFISENFQKDGADGVTHSGRIHVFNSENSEFEKVIEGPEDSQGLGYFGSVLAVNNKYLAVASQRDDSESFTGSRIHVFDLRKDQQIYSIKPEEFGVKLEGNLELDEDKLLMSTVDQGGKSSIYEFDLSTREKNLEKFTRLMANDLETLSTVKDSVVVNRLRVDNIEIEANQEKVDREVNLEKFSEYQTRDQENMGVLSSTANENREKVSSYVKHLEDSLKEEPEKNSFFSVQSNVANTRVMDLLP